jgi:hypothetical protein
MKYLFNTTTLNIDESDIGAHNYYCFWARSLTPNCNLDATIYKSASYTDQFKSSSYLDDQVDFILFRPESVSLICSSIQISQTSGYGMVGFTQSSYSDIDNSNPSYLTEKKQVDLIRFKLTSGKTYQFSFNSYSDVFFSAYLVYLPPSSTNFLSRSDLSTSSSLIGTTKHSDVESPESITYTASASDYYTLIFVYEKGTIESNIRFLCATDNSFGALLIGLF